VLRVISSAAAWYAISHMHVGRTVAVPGYAVPAHRGMGRTLLDPWLRSDALWYLKIAVHGYGDGSGPSFAFFPAFPIATRLLRFILGGDELLAALAVASLATIGGLFFLYQFSRELMSDNAARATVAGFVLFPTAFFLVSPYGESVFFFASTGALWMILRKRYLAAFLFGALAGLSRPTGFVLTLALAGFAIAQSRERIHVADVDDGSLPHLSTAQGSGTRKDLVFSASSASTAALSPLAGLALWVMYTAIRLGDPLAFIHAQTYWQRSLMAFPLTISKGVESWFAFRATDYGPYFLVDLLALIFCIALIAAVVVVSGRNQVRFEGVGLASFGAALLLLPLTSVFLARPLLSMPRFALGLAPLFVVYAGISKKLRIPLALLSAAASFAATAVFVAARPLY
jgi:hypothetical protein